MKDLAVVIPLFLDGPAFAMYDELKEEEKRDADKIELALRAAFACDKFLAYDEFRNRQWKNIESIDVYLANLKRLAHLANVDGENEEIIKLSFVMVLPNKVSAQLRVTPKIDTLDLTAILQISRALMTEIFKSDLIKVGAVERSNTSATTLRCFNCGGPHYRKDCIKAKEIICYACGKRGHIARLCAARNYNSAGNENGALCAPAMAPVIAKAQSSQE